MRLLAIGCHADDIDLGCAGTLAKLTKDDWEVHILIVTDGAGGGDSVQRVAEQRNALDFIQPKSVRFLELPDRELVASKLVPHIEEATGHLLPDLTLVNSPVDTHQDHRACAIATKAALRTNGNLLFYQAMTTQEFLPTVFVDITAFCELKLDMLRAHESQCGRRHLDHLAATWWTYHALQAGCRAAEGFVPWRLTY